MLEHYNFTDKEQKKLLDSIVIICDNREQKNDHITTYFDSKKIPWVRKKLNYADYSFYIPKNEELSIPRDLWFDNDIVIERKNSLEEISSCFTESRDRLKKEFAFDFDKIANNVIMSNYYNPNAEVNQDNLIDEHYQNIVDGCIIHAKSHENPDADDYTLDDWKGKNDKSVLLSSEIVDKLYSLYGLTDKNRRKNRDDDGALPILFFTASQVRRIFKGHNAIKSISNINETLNSFVEKGFLQKLPYKSASRNENVFYVEPLILDVQEQYEITAKDRIEAIAVIKQDMYIFNEKDIKLICKDYKIRFSDVERHIEDHSEI